MFKKISLASPTHVTLLALPNCNFASIATITDILHRANAMGNTLYTYDIITPDSTAISSSCGLDLHPTHDIDTIVRPDNLIICASGDISTYFHQKVFHYIKHWKLQNSHIGSVGTGAFLLASCGILHNKTCSINVGYASLFTHLYPAIKTTLQSFYIDKKCFTSCDGMAVLDMMLYGIAQEHGTQFSRTIAHSMGYTPTEKPTYQPDISVKNPTVHKAVKIMLKTVRKPLQISDLSAQVGKSPRQLERIFQDILHTSPNRHYKRLRLEKAHSLLLQTPLPLSNIATECGFSSVAYLKKSYTEYFGFSPDTHRR